MYLNNSCSENTFDLSGFGLIVLDFFSNTNHNKFSHLILSCTFKVQRRECY
jgi:hypothetical protein